ncbi:MULTISPECIES: DUF4160 domain-containing protein [unclassified Microcoleus]|uniref:DUF4160 domain-containing protein n=1 Tax=unclassified Microcoleus TaxID=2642155 RepID=UPI002FD623D5
MPTIVRNRQDACSTKDKFSCGTGILPVPKKLIENGAISQYLSFYRLYFYSHEPNEPPHVHIDRDKSSVKFWLEPVNRF